MSEDPLAPVIVKLEEVEEVEIAPGITRRALTSTPFATGWVIDFAPGSRWPELDRHPTEERYYVISGEMIEGDVPVAAGSYVTFPGGSSHQPHTRIGATILGINLTGLGA